MERVTTPRGTTVSWRKEGSGPPLVLVHGAFSDHESNWAFVTPILRERFTVHAVARRGRGETDATSGHTLEDECADVAAVAQAIGEPLFLLGHSYGAHCSLVAASLVPASVRKLVVYEPAWPSVLSPEMMVRWEELGAAEKWDEFATSFFRDGLQVQAPELDALKASENWPPILADAKATLGDLRAFTTYDFVPERFRELAMPVLLQVGTESPRDLYATDALAAVLPNARIEELAGQAHEGMTTAPEMYAEAVTRFLLP